MVVPPRTPHHIFMSDAPMQTWNSFLRPQIVSPRTSGRAIVRLIDKVSRPESLSFDATLEEYEQQARALFDALEAGDEEAQWRVKWVHPRFRGKSIMDVQAETLGLADAKAVVARENGFETWADLADFAETVRTEGAVNRFEKAVEAGVSGDITPLERMLQAHPDLARARSPRRHHATLLHYIAANGVEGARQKTPPNAVAIGETLLKAGAEVDALADMYDQKCTTMSMLVSSCHPAEAGLQGRLAELLIDYGAALNGAGSKW